MTLMDGWVWEDEEDEEQLSDESFERKLGNQGVELMDEGCGMTYELITAGPCAGEVWSFSDVGVSPCCERQDFLGWFELWLDSDGDPRLFQGLCLRRRRIAYAARVYRALCEGLILVRLGHLVKVLVRH